MGTIRALLALVAAENLECEPMDFSSAYLMGEVDIPIYMRQPPGFELDGRENEVCEFKKTLYGLKSKADEPGIRS